MKLVKFLFLSIFSLSILPLSAQNDKIQSYKIEFITPSIVRVQASPTNTIEENGTGVCVYAKQNIKLDIENTDNDQVTVYKSSNLNVFFAKESRAIRIENKNGDVLLNQTLNHIKAEPSVQERIIYDEKSAHVEETANGKVTVKDIIRRDTIGQSTRFYIPFLVNNAKAIYGLGAHMEDYMNLQGKTMYLTQHNLKAMVPMLITNTGVGVLFDAGCAMKFTGSKYEGYNEENKEGIKDECFTMQLEAAKSVDFYVIAGGTMDKVIAGYRYLTGNASLMPKYVFGYTQSKERYTSSDDILKTLKQYRDRHVPIDMIVQDWNYWPQGWGYMKMDPKFYPDPKALADSVHALGAKLMVSIWPNPQWCPEAEDFKSRGMMLEHDVYDVFNPEARKHYWKYANDEFYSRGFDAWWCDSSEPLDGDWNQLPKPENGIPYGWDSQERRWQLNKDVLSEALGIERSSLYSLYHSMGIYENQRLTKNPSGIIPRVVNLTRSTYAGQQRYGTIVWNGDTHASWKSFKQQIPSGLNYMATGNPYWTVDVGSFFTRSNGRQWFYKGEFQQGVKDDNYKEYYVRMFQWGTFLPMLRSHGSDTPREIWQFGEPGTQYYDAILKMINLRYEHIPYIYSMAARQTFDGYTMARLLAFDFADDEQVLDIKDEYMFGDYLVCPVTDPLSQTKIRKLYLPKGAKWIDYWNGTSYEGGKWLDYELTKGVAQFPLFIKAGSIIPTTEIAENVKLQLGKPITINIYPGADAEFTLYDDEGDNYNYENQAFTNIKLQWNDAKRTLTIANREGSFDGMLKDCTFIVTTKELVKNAKTKTIKYKGNKTAIKL